MMMQQKMMSGKVKKLTVIDIFAPFLKFDRQFCFKKFYMGIFAHSSQVHEDFCISVLFKILFTEFKDE